MFAHILKYLKNNSTYEHTKQKNNQHYTYPNTTNSNILATEQESRNIMWQQLRAALRGDKEAQYQMGLSYLNGQNGLDRNYTHAEKWLDQADHQGHTEAKNQLNKALNDIAFS